MRSWNFWFRFQAIDELICSRCVEIFVVFNIRNTKFIFLLSCFENLGLEVDNAALTAKIDHHCTYTLRAKCPRVESSEAELGLIWTKSTSESYHGICSTKSEELQPYYCTCFRICLWAIASTWYLWMHLLAEWFVFWSVDWGLSWRGSQYSCSGTNVDSTAIMSSTRCVYGSNRRQFSDLARCSDVTSR